jgi:hypothetical protein
MLLGDICTRNSKLPKVSVVICERWRWDDVESVTDVFVRKGLFPKAMLLVVTDAPAA